MEDVDIMTQLKPLLHYAFLESENTKQSSLGTLKSDLIPTSQTRFWEREKKVFAFEYDPQSI